MTLHLYMNHICPEFDCGCVYIPYNETIPCPKCGKQEEMENYFPLIEGICESFIFNIGDVGSFTPMCWATMDLSDAMQLILFHLFEKWIKESISEKFKDYSDDFISRIDCQDQDYMRDYLKKLSLDIYEEFFTNRDIKITVNDDMTLVINQSETEEEQ